MYKAILLPFLVFFSITFGEMPELPKIPILPEVNLNVQFFPQAPDADWSLPWEEACEEASLILAYYFKTDQTLTKTQFKEHLIELVEWQKRRFGDYEDTNVAETAQMLEEFLGFTDYEILTDPTLEDLKREMTLGHVLVTPVDGRLLRNPYYSNGGPDYHMLVVKGYDETHFITHDVGTRRGDSYRYDYKTFMNSLHDLGEGIPEPGDRKVLVLR